MHTIPILNCIKMRVPINFALQQNVLYHLQPTHPVIDAVLWIKSGERIYLILLQISLLSYSDHKTKYRDLHLKVSAPEKNLIILPQLCITRSLFLHN